MPITQKKFEFWLNNFMLVVAVLILVVVLIGDQSLPRVIATNLPSKVSPAEQRFIKIDFSRLMDRKSVEDNFEIEPAMSGKFSWSGKSLVYTLDNSFSYGQSYWLKIGANAKSQDGKPFTLPYELLVKVDLLRMAYISTSSEDQGKIIFADLSGKIEQKFTDGNYQVDQFIISPDKQWIYFLGNRQEKENELFSVEIATGKVQQLTNDSKFLNKTFDLSDDGKLINLSRIEVSTTGEYLTRIEVWLADTSDFQFTKFKDGIAQGIDSAFSPSGTYLLYRNQDGNFQLSRSVLKKDEQDEALYIGEYSANFGFHPFLPKIGFTQYDQEDVFSLNNNLIVFAGDGGKVQATLPKGVTRDFVFSQDGRSAIVLFSGEQDNLTTADSLSEARVFHLYKYNFADDSIVQLTKDSDYSEFDPKLSHDSRFLIFQRVIALPENLIDPAFRQMQEDVGGSLSEQELWLMDLKTGEMKSLRIEGNQVKFLP